MARAKKTYRAEARRRTRAIPAANAAAAGTGGSNTAVTGSSTATAGDDPAQAGARPSFLGPFRDAIRPIDLRADIRQIPWLVTRTNAVWLPSLLVVASAVWYSSSGGQGSLQYYAFVLFVYPPPQMGALFLAGILTERMSYMAGGLVGLVCAIVFALYLTFGTIPPGALQGTQREVLILGSMVLSPLGGFLIGGFAGFYRRFLRRANAKKVGRQPPAKGKSTKAPARR